MKNYKKLFNSQRGDTIVEVVLALTILALVLGTSSVLANRNSRTLQTFQENTYALRIAQRQLEYIKSFAATHSSELPASAATFCMENASTLQTNVNSCARQDGGASYGVSIQSTPAADGAYDVTATVRWETLTGIPGNVELTYRIYTELGASEAHGEGDVCPAGTSGTVPNCIPNTPSIRVSVRKIAPNSGDTTPDCSKAASQTRGGTTVRLSGPTIRQQATGGDSTTLFTGLEPFNFYQAQITGVPSGFQICPPNTSGLTQARADTTPNLEFKIRPICYQETRYTAPYHHYSAPYDHYSAPYHHYTAPYDHGSWAAWWDHPGPDRRIGGVGNSTFRQTEHGQTVEYRARPDLGGSPMFFELWVWMTVWVSTGYYGDYLGYYADYLGNYADYLGYYADPYTANVCPS